MKRVKIIPLLLCLIWATGCIFQDIEPCYTTLHFSYKGDGDKEMMAEKFEKIDLYVFDENDACVLTRTLTPEELRAQKADVLITNGKTYRVVSFGNTHTCQTHRLHEGTISDSRLQHPACHPENEMGGELLDSYDALYHGAETVIVPRAGAVSETVQFCSSHIDMYVEVVGYQTPGGTRADPSDINIEHDNMPAWLDFDNRHSKHTDFSHEAMDVVSHYPETRIVDGNYVHEYNVLRGLSESTIHIKNSTGEVIYSLSVDEFLANHPEINTEQNEALVPIRIEFTGTDVVVSIPEWAIEITHPEF